MFKLGGIQIREVQIKGGILLRKIAVLAGTKDSVQIKEGFKLEGFKLGRDKCI